MYNCKLCNKECKSLQSLSKHITSKHKEYTKEEYYNKFIKTDLDNSGICPICRKRTPFKGFYGYQYHCGPKCAGIDENTKIKRETTNNKLFGANYNFQSSNWREKAKQIKLKKYNNENYNNRELYKENYIKNHGVFNPAQDPVIQKRIIQTSIQRYGTKRPQQSNLIKEKYKQTCQNKYGTNCYYQSEQFKLKSKQTSLLHYGVDIPIKSDIVKRKSRNTCLLHYGYEYNLQRPEIIQKANSVESQNKSNETKRRHHTFNTSKIEDQTYIKLINIFGKNDIERNYKSKDYPHLCDFYIKSLDLYIELNIHWTHGKHWFNISNKQDLHTLSIWQEKAKTSKYYQYAINTWTKLDVDKRKDLQFLNSLVLWTEQEVNDWINNIKERQLL